jgi:hypothetical protein
VLVHARHDLHAHLLSGEEYEAILSSVQTIAEQQNLSADVAADHSAEVDADLPARPSLTVLACPAQNGAESTALHLFRQLLDPHKFQFDIVSAKRLVSEVLELVEQQCPAVVCIAALPTGGLTHTRHLCKRLKSRFPQQKILVCRWGAGPAPDHRDQWAKVGADYLATTLAESMQQLDELAQFLRPAQGDRSMPRPHFPAEAGQHAGEKLR